MKTLQWIYLALLLTGSLVGQELPRASLWKRTLSQTPAPEVPRLAANWVKEAALPEREIVTIGVVEAAMESNAAAGPAVVAAIARAVPEMARIAAATAAAKAPTEAGTICKAATSAAPAMAGNIVDGICKAVPEQYRTVAIAAAEVAPRAGREILRAVGSARPGLRPHLDAEIAKYERGSPPVGLILDRMPMGQTNAPGASSGPTARPVVLDSSASANGNDGHPKGDNGWHGGRNYARP